MAGRSFMGCISEPAVALRIQAPRVYRQDSRLLVGGSGSRIYFCAVFVLYVEQQPALISSDALCFFESILSTWRLYEILYSPSNIQCNILKCCIITYLLKYAYFCV